MADRQGRRANLLVAAMQLVRIARRPAPRLPAWLRKPATDFQRLHELKVELRARGLRTVCESARCPNIHECFGRRSATFMILGNSCTRTCGFCAVPQGRGETLDRGEPRQVAAMAARMGLRYVVITSVNRDDLPDGGSTHFAATVRAVQARAARGSSRSSCSRFLRRPAGRGPPARRRARRFQSQHGNRPRGFTAACAPQADYARSLAVLRFAKRHSPQKLTKSGLMVGLGETRTRCGACSTTCAGAGADIATIGQYLQPRRNRLPVEDFIRPEAFERYREYGEAAGFRAVFSGPFVRSSYMADIVEERAAGRHEPRPAAAPALAHRRSAARGTAASPRFPPGVAVVARAGLLAPLLAAVDRAPPRRRLLLGWLSGVVFWGGACYWVFPVMRDYAGIAAPAAAALYAAFAAVKGLHSAAFAALAGPLLGRPWAVPAIAALWTALEGSHQYLGFTWTQLGNAAPDFALPQIARLAPWTGVYGPSFVFAAVNAAVALAVMRRRFQPLAFSRRCCCRPSSRRCPSPAPAPKKPA